MCVCVSVHLYMCVHACMCEVNCGICTLVLDNWPVMQPVLGHCPLIALPSNINKYVYESTKGAILYVVLAHTSGSLI